jgi:peptidoglycan/LPS O-acetylase OafA/YrhL
MNMTAPSNMPGPITDKSGFRRDILGLRGLAVLFVLADHFNFPGSEAGFIGVDMFFVISGYLIIGLLLKEYLHNGKSLGGYGWISIGSFFQRRIRRILPAAIFVIAAIFLASLLIQDDEIKKQTRQDSLWSLLFVSNINFAQRSTDYFASSDLVSPFMHYWSLAVEEQFYLLIPFLFMAVVNWHGFSVAGRRLQARPRIMLVLATLCILSLTSLIILSFNPTTSLYFQTFPRMWEFLIGGLAALLKPKISHRSKIYLLLLRRVSYFILVLSFLFISSTSSMVVLVFPVFATAIILYVNQQLRFGFLFEKVLINSMVTFFGRISYSLYLWHWPILIYSKYLGLQLTWISSVGLFFAVVGVSVVSERFVERPFLRVGYIADFHSPEILKSRRVTAGAFLVLAGGLFVATYQPLISTYISKVTAEREQAYWTPPLENPGVTSVSPSKQPKTSPPEQITSKKSIYLGIFGDSTVQCCSATGAFWPRLLAQNFNWQFADYSRPATSFMNSGVGSNKCASAEDCPSVEGQLTAASKKSFDAISITSGIGDCLMARKNPDELQRDIQKILQNFRRTYPTALIFTTGLAVPIVGSNSDCNSRMDNIIRSASEASNIIYIDLSRVVSNPKAQLTVDSAHLNDSGHALIAKYLVNKLKKTPEFLQMAEK